MPTLTLPRFVANYSVSTDKHGHSGLSLEAQRVDVTAYVTSVARGNVEAEFVEVESFRQRDRPQLAGARPHCAVLVIATLNRLALNARFVSERMESGAEFVAADMPAVNRLTVHILAAVAEEGARIISARTKAALATARGVRLSNPNLCPDIAEQARAANAAKAARARAWAADVLPAVEQARRAGAATLQQFAHALTAWGVRPPCGRGATWYPVEAARVERRARSRL